MKKTWWLLLFLLGVSSVAVAQVNMVYNGSFESGQPALWNAIPGTSGATLTWATDQYVSATHSLKIEKPSTGTSAAMWQSDNFVRYWTTRIFSGVDIKLGAWVKTQNVNTNPANIDAQWYIQFAFYDSAGAMIGGQPFILPVPQTTASTVGWVDDTNAVASVILPKDAWKLIVSVVAGKNATGTVWVDDFIFLGRGGAWSGAMFNNSVEADKGWYYWWPDKHDATGDVENLIFVGSGTTTEAAHTGMYSFKMNAPKNRQPGEIVWISEFVPIPANSAGKQYVLSAWVKTKGINPDSMKRKDNYRIGFTWTWHRSPQGEATGWNMIRAEDYVFTLPPTDTATDWRQYSTIITVPSNDTRYVSVRARSWSGFEGTAYYDDFVLVALPTVITGVEEQYNPTASGTAIPTDYELFQNYPNPFNPSTTIRYVIPTAGFVTLRVYNILGEEVASLVGEQQTAGIHQVTFDASRLPSGVYFYRLGVGNYVGTMNIVLMK